MTPDPVLLSARDFEAGIIGWCLSHPDEFHLYADRVADHHFQFDPWKVVWGLLLRAYRLHGVFPTCPELKHMVGNIRDLDWDTKVRLQTLSEEVYGSASTAVSGQALVTWLNRREMSLISDHTARLCLSPEKVPEELPSLLTRLEELSVINGGSTTSQGVSLFSEETFSRLDDLIAELYVGDTIPTGFPKVDAVLRGGGVRSHLVIYSAPPGVAKTTLALHTALYNVRRGRRFVYFAMDDPLAEIIERVKSHMLKTDASELEWDKAHLDRVLDEERRNRYPGDLFLEAVESNKLTPRDFEKRLMSLQRRFLLEDRRKGIPEEECGRIHGAILDSGDQVKDTVKAEVWERKKLTYEEIGAVSMRLGFPIFVTTQPGQDAVGAAQMTQRNMGESFGKIKPAKLILGATQTYVMSHEKQRIEFSHPTVAANLCAMDTVDRDHDRATEWTPFWLGVLKNNRARSTGGAPVKHVKFPMLVHYPSARMTTDWTKTDEMILEDKKTKREEREAAGPEDRKAPPEVVKDPTSKRGSK